MTGCRLIHDPEGLNTGVWPAPAGLPLTPAGLFFTRSHAPVPQINPGAWRLEVGGLVDRPRRFSLEELGHLFPRREVTATLVCAGLRRDEFLSLGPLPGELPWGAEPAGTGHWTGFALGDLLGAVGVAGRARYVEFLGLDQVERQGRRFGFGGSIDLAKALSAEVVLASELNGAPLPPAHGFPLRSVVPGWIGARSVKWLGRVTLLEEPSTNYFQSQAYRLQPKPDAGDPRNVSAGEALSGVPINAVILDPVENQVVPAGPVRIRGWAMGSAGRPITAVELSATEKCWYPARLAGPPTPWAWSCWEVELDLPRGRHTIAVRASDTAGTTQPATVSTTWNVKGYNNNAWHRVTVQAQ
ncbi:MAG: sulfite oxidase [Gemmatimonadales bacterium]|nr:sulfite oxidase [Gemmatimonadales bacterium]